MSYIDIGRDKDCLPMINSARRIKALESELQAYRMRENASLNAPVGILKHDSKYDGSQSWRAIGELQDQVRTFRDELRKKDTLIQHLTSVDPTPPKIPRAPESYKYDSIYMTSSTADSTRTELATLQVKYEKAQVQIRELQNEMESREIKIREFQNLTDSNKDTESRLTSIITSLREKLADYEARAGSFETVAERGEITIATLQRDNREARDKIVELDTRLRKQIDEREANEHHASSSNRRLNEVLNELNKLIYHTDDMIDASPASVDNVIRKFTDLVQENAMLKGKIVTLSEHMNENHLETKASRETIMRLVSEVGREQKVATRYTSEIENLRMERDNALASRRGHEEEIVLLKERLDANHRSLEATKSELELREKRLNTLDREYRQNAQSIRCTSTQFDLFREQIANLLNIVFTDVQPTEDHIKEAVQKLARDKKELDVATEDYENRIKSLTTQLDQELGLHREMAERSKRFETETDDMAQRLRCAEGELATGDVLRDGLKFDKEKYLRGLQKLGEIMKMDRISLDLGLDLTMDALLSRAEQLVKLEAGSIADKSTHVYNLQRKVKALKEQLESKELHIDLLRKKMTNLEERLHGRSDIVKEKENESTRLRKLEKLIEKYKMQLQDSRHEVQNLKAQLLGSGELKVRTLEQRKDIDELVKQIEELEEVRKRQARKIYEMKNNFDCNETDMAEKKLASENAVQALSSELRTTKNALDSLKYREKQLVDFRTVVARMLGLDINTLAVPDYEVISRLEKLIQAHHTTAFTTLNLEEALADAHEGTLDVTRRTLEVADPMVSRTRERSRRRAAKNRARARSVSPMRRDTRA